MVSPKNEHTLQPTIILKRKFNFHQIKSPSRRADGTESSDSLMKSIIHPSLPAGFLDYIQWPNRTVVYVLVGWPTLVRLCVGVHPYFTSSAQHVFSVLLGWFVIWEVLFWRYVVSKICPKTIRSFLALFPSRFLSVCSVRAIVVHSHSSTDTASLEQFMFYFIKDKR